MNNEKDEIKISKLLSLALRHKPQEIGIELDENGWTDVNTLIKGVNESGTSLTLEVLKKIVDTNTKKRFAFNEQFDKIRASQGHSVSVDLGYNPVTPPEILFHGTGEKSVAAISRSGIQKRDRQYVHLSADIETAIKVGQRHGTPFVFKIAAGEMSRNGFKFFIADNGVWLTDDVPEKYLKK